MPKIRFTGRVWGATRQQIRKDVLQAAQSSPALRKEISRVFQQANRRIQNIERTELFSPAVSALNLGDKTGFTKFSMSQSWEDLKHDYGRAVAFLRQPTSTATGVNQYNEHLRTTYDLSKEEFDLMSKSINNRVLSLSDSDFVERYLMRYKDFTGELEQSASDISGQIETNAVSIQNAIDRELQRVADEAADEMGRLDSEIRSILEGFNLFGL